MYYSKSKEKIYACECKVEKEFLKKSKLKNFKILHALQKGRNIVRSFVKTPLFLHRLQIPPLNLDILKSQKNVD